MARPVRPWELPEDNKIILSTSYAPNNAEIQALRSRNEGRLAEISKIEASLDFSPRTLALKWAMWNSAVVAGGLLAPVRKLPAEILGDIFTLCIPQVPWEEMVQRPYPRVYEKGQYPSDMRQALLKVSRQWNIVAFATPSVWSSLTVDFSKFNVGEVELCIVHSKARPLDIYMEGHYRPLEPRDPPGRIEMILGLLRPEIRRMRRLLFTYSTDKHVHTLFPRDQIMNAPKLETFVSTPNYGHENEKSSLQMLGGIHAPRIRTIVLGVTPAVLASFSVDSRRNLRRLIINCPGYWRRGPSAFCYLTGIALCSSLTELELWSVWFDESNPRTPSKGVKVSLPYLKSLKIFGSVDKEIQDFLSQILVPNLELLLVDQMDKIPFELRLLFPGPRDQSRFEQGLQALHAQVLNSFKDLTVAAIDLVRNPGPIPLFTNLVSLRLTDLFIGDQLLDSLTPKDLSTSWPCPFLKSLTFTRIIVSLPGNGLITLIRNRTCDDNEANPPAHCTFITLDKCGIIDDVGFHSLELRWLADSRGNTLRINEYVHAPVNFVLPRILT